MFRAKKQLAEANARLAVVVNLAEIADTHGFTVEPIVLFRAALDGATLAELLEYVTPATLASEAQLAEDRRLSSFGGG